MTNIKYTSQFGEKLKAIRTQHGWSQEELAEKLNTSKQVISRYERGERTPKISVAARYAIVLGVSLSDLTGIPPKFSVEEVQAAVLNAPPVPDLEASITADQLKTINKLSQLTPENRIRFDAFLDGLLAGQEKPEA